VDKPEATAPTRGAAQAEKQSMPAGTLEKVALGLADQVAVLYDVRPDDPRIRFADDQLSFSFQGGLTPADEALLERGKGEELRLFREAFFETIADQLGAVVGSLTHSPVTFFSIAFDAETRTTNCYFTLGNDPDSVREQRRAVLNWSEQVRRNARELRQRHRDTREAHARLRDLLKEVREDSDRG
jgi:Na+-translocating membrane potential-generating system (MpsC)